MRPIDLLSRVAFRVRFGCLRGSGGVAPSAPGRCRDSPAPGYVGSHCPGPDSADLIVVGADILARMSWTFDLTVTDEAVSLVRNKGGTIALDFIPPIS